MAHESGHQGTVRITRRTSDQGSGEASEDYSTPSSEEDSPVKTKKFTLFTAKTNHEDFDILKGLEKREG